MSTCSGKIEILVMWLSCCYAALEVTTDFDLAATNWPCSEYHERSTIHGTTSFAAGAQTELSRQGMKACTATEK